MSQQEVIDLAIASYLKTNDNTARQYLKLRQDALEVTQKIKKEVTESGSMSAETALKLEKLKFENAKSSLVYKAYIDNITSNLESEGVTGGQISSGLNERFEEISEKKKRKDEGIDQLLKNHKPVVEKMRLLAEKFENGLAVRSRRPGFEGNIFTSKGSEPDENSILLEFASTVFSKKELEEQFFDVESKLANLKTVDEISNEAEAEAESENIAESGPSINLSKYLDEILEGGRAYQRVDDANYQYDITRSPPSDLGDPKAVISDYENAIDNLTKEIQGLVARGTDAKERWISNAQKIELIQTMFSEDMDIDG
ncbi:hypothetical protein JCM33374_g1130 [Metschnikowia sp. JCM 33374]|nr:hypothetical protein JCM33374_g1130 [Metschnikowia sp. JCM 33374]